MRKYTKSRSFGSTAEVDAILDALPEETNRSVYIRQAIKEKDRLFDADTNLILIAVPERLRSRFIRDAIKAVDLKRWLDALIKKKNGM